MLKLDLQLFAEESGAEPAPAAEVQTETVEVPESQTGAEPTAAAEPEKQNNFEKAFAKRLSAEREKWQAEVQQKYGDYDDVKSVADYFREINQAPDILTLKEQVELAKLQERAEQQNVPTEVMKRIDELEAKAAKAEAYEQQQAETQERQQFEESLKTFCAEKGIDHNELWLYMYENGIANQEVAYNAMRAANLEQQLSSAKETAIKEYLASKSAPRVEGAGTPGITAVDTSKLDWKDVRSVALARIAATNQSQ